MREFLQFLISGIEQGSIYALWAVGYALVYQVLGLLHFAYGNILLLSCYVVTGLVATNGIPLWSAVCCAIVVAVVASVLTERVVYARFIERKQIEAGFVAAIAVGFLFTNLGTSLWGVQPLFFPTIVPNHAINVDGLVISGAGLIVLGVSLGTLALLTAFLRVTKVGRAVVLTGQNANAASLVGIPVRRIVTLVYAVSGLLGCLGALMFASLFNGVNSDQAVYISFQAFLVATVGGVGSLTGSLVGGLLLGVAEAMLVGYVSSNFAEALAWCTLAVVVLVRPQGLLGRRVVDRV